MIHFFGMMALCILMRENDYRVKVAFRFGGNYMEWKNIYRGFVMGVSDVVPGVSGGTIAVLLGIYDRLIAAINGVFSREWKRHLLFLIPLGIGVATAIFSFSRVMDWLLEHHHRLTFYFFIGLIIGVLPFLFHASGARQAFRIRHILLLIVGALSISFLPVDLNENPVITDRSFSIYIILFFSGFLASAAMILPGISGSFVLVLIGMYQTIIRAVSDFEISVILIVGTGIAIGLVTMSKIIHYFFKRYRTAAFALIIGLVIGSIFVIFRQAGWVESPSELILGLIIFISGLLIAYILGKVEYE